MTNYNDVFKKFEKFIHHDAVLHFSDSQKEMMGDILGIEGDEFENLKTCFFKYEDLEDVNQQSLWAYGLMNCNLENECDEKKVIPFAALNASGKTLSAGHDIFAETNNWGVLCLLLHKGEAEDCPVVWIYEGDVYQWSSNTESLKAEII